MPMTRGRSGRRGPRAPNRTATRSSSSALVPDPSRAASGVTIGVAAGPALLREVLCKALGSDPGVSVTGQASAEDGIAALLEQTHPQILLFDYEALGPNGEGMINRLHRQFPSTRILVLATRSGPETVERVLHAGASGLVGKESELATVVRAIRAVASGEVWANRLATARALEHLSGVSTHGSATRGNLTRREGEIVTWVARGLRNKEIAQRLGINEKTVKTHLNNIFRKLQIDNRIALAMLGVPELQPKT